METCARVAERVLSAIMDQVKRSRVSLEAIIVQTSMILPGNKCPKKKKPTPFEIAQSSVAVVKKCISPVVPLVGFLSGTLREVDAVQTLTAISNCQEPRPWPTTFSFGRTLQAGALRKWKGKRANVKAA